MWAVTLTLQGEALINDKINWLALIFAIYSVSSPAQGAACGGWVIREQQPVLREFADSLGMVVGLTCHHSLCACFWGGGGRRAITLVTMQGWQQDHCKLPSRHRFGSTAAGRDWPRLCPVFGSSHQHLLLIEEVMLVIRPDFMHKHSLAAAVPAEACKAGPALKSQGWQP